MKKILNIAAPAVITKQTVPASLALSLIQVDGRPLTQSEDTTKNIWIPDRSITPLILQPDYECLDQETKEVTKPNAVVRWYLDEVKVWDSATKTGEIPVSYTTSDGYYLERNGSTLTGRLIVTDNIHYCKEGSYRGPVNIICVVTYDSVKYGHLEESCGVTLTSQNVPDEIYTLTISNTSPIIYHIFSDESTQKTIKAVAYKGKEIISGSQLQGLKFFWYIYNAGDYDLITDADRPMYVSGQGTDTLVVDADYTENANFRVMLADSTTATAPNQLCFATVNLVWSVPMVEALPYSKSSSAVKDVEGEKEFDSIVSAGGQELTDEAIDEYIRLRWIAKDINTDYDTRKVKGWGRTLVMDNDEFYGQAGDFRDANKVEVSLEAYVLKAKEQVTCNGQDVKCNNEDVYCRN